MGPRRRGSVEFRSPAAFSSAALTLSQRVDAVDSTAQRLSLDVFVA